MSVSWWRLTERAERVECDLVVVGAGIAGVSAALAAERAGLRVVVVERHTVGWGASSRNAGYLMRGAADNYGAACRDWGREGARELWSWTEDNLRLLREEGIDQLSGYRAIPSCLVATGKEELGELRESIALMREDGFETGWVESGSDSLWRSGVALGGLVNPDDAACDPAELIGFLASKLGEPVRESEEVFAIEPGDRGVVVRTTGLEIRAQHMFICTNAYTSRLLPGIPIEANRGQMLAVRAPGVTLDASYYLNHGSEYIRTAADATVVVGGCRKAREAEERTSDDTATEAVQEAIESFARPVLGEYEVVARWAGTMGFTPDGLPLVGPVPSLDPDGRVWVCGGFTGHGMSLAFQTAKTAVAAMLEGREHTFALDRFAGA